MYPKPRLNSTATTVRTAILWKNRHIGQDNRLECRNRPTKINLIFDKDTEAI